MTPEELAFVTAAAFLAGLVNSIAGGGTMFSFPALLWTGMDPRVANATSTLALWPGSLSGAWGFRSDFKRDPRSLRRLILLSCTCLVGGAVGAFLLLVTPSRVFMLLVPWLILFATVLFMGQGSGPAESGGEGEPSTAWWMATVGFQFLVAVYGGYFGAGAGILTLASLGLHAIHDLQEANGIKNLLVFCMNTLAVVCFAFFGLVQWKVALCMSVGAVAGGYGAAPVARRLGRRRVRMLVIVAGLTVGLVTMWRAYT